MSDNTTIVVHTTLEGKEEALALGRILLEKRLIACAQVESPVDSLYWWKGVIEQAQEYRLVMKSSQDLWNKLQQEIQKHHPYDVPEIIAVPVFAVSESYQQWLGEELQQ